MSRSGYSDDIESWDLIRWRGAVKSAIRGSRGQQFLKALRDALEALPEKRLIDSEVITPQGECCAIGALALHNQVDVSNLDPYDYEGIGKAFDIAEALAREVFYENDEGGCGEIPEERFQRMRKWVESQIIVDS